jgi:hypothetical protein
VGGARLTLAGLGPGNTQVQVDYANDVSAVLLSAPPQGEFLLPSLTGAPPTPIVVGVPFKYPSQCVARFQRLPWPASLC